MFEGEGVCFLKQRAELASVATRLLNDPEERERVKRCLDIQAMELDPFDGRNARRVTQVLADAATANF